MGEFGNTVDSLLETYSKCLSLLKSLKGVNNNDKQPRQLRKSIRSDRSKVRSVYSTRLSVSGSHLEKGDGICFYTSHSSRNIVLTGDHSCGSVFAEKSYQSSYLGHDQATSSHHQRTESYHRLPVTQDLVQLIPC